MPSSLNDILNSLLYLVKPEREKGMGWTKLGTQFGMLSENLRILLQPRSYEIFSADEEKKKTETRSYKIYSAEEEKKKEEEEGEKEKEEKEEVIAAFEFYKKIFNYVNALENTNDETLENNAKKLRKAANLIKAAKWWEIFEPRWKNEFLSNEIELNENGLSAEQQEKLIKIFRESDVDAFKATGLKYIQFDIDFLDGLISQEKDSSLDYTEIFFTLGRWLKEYSDGERVESKVNLKDYLEKLDATSLEFIEEMVDRIEKYLKSFNPPEESVEGKIVSSSEEGARKKGPESGPQSDSNSIRQPKEREYPIVGRQGEKDYQQPLRFQISKNRYDTRKKNQAAKKAEEEAEIQNQRVLEEEQRNDEKRENELKAKYDKRLEEERAEETERSEAKLAAAEAEITAEEAIIAAAEAGMATIEAAPELSESASEEVGAAVQAEPESTAETTKTVAEIARASAQQAEAVRLAEATVAAEKAELERETARTAAAKAAAQEVKNTPTTPFWNTPSNPPLPPEVKLPYEGSNPDRLALVDFIRHLQKHFVQSQRQDIQNNYNDILIGALVFASERISAEYRYLSPSGLTLFGVRLYGSRLYNSLEEHLSNVENRDDKQLAFFKYCRSNENIYNDFTDDDAKQYTARDKLIFALYECIEKAIPRHSNNSLKFI